MTRRWMRTACWLACSLTVPAVVLAQAPQRMGYLLDSSGNFVGSATPGQCWHSGQWTPALAVAPCDMEIQKIAAVQVPVEVPAAPPEPVVMAPVPAATAAVPPQFMNFSADALFGFDKAVLGPAGMKMLDTLVEQTHDGQYDFIHVHGHTDRIGTQAYNQKLSLRRANAVRDYLVSQGIPEPRINATGEGESAPLTLSTECLGAVNPAVIACLQQDRRVAVEMEGVKTVVRTP